MLPAKFYKHFGLRIKLTKFALGTYYQWDSKTEQLVEAPPYLIYGMYAGFNGGCWLVFLHSLHMYMKTSTSMDIPEARDSENEDIKSSRSLKEFATLLIQGGEVLLITCCTFLNLVFLRRRLVFMKLFNQLLNYNKKLSELIERGELSLTEDQQLVVKMSTALLYVVITISVFLPFFVLAAFSNEIEPHHQMFEEYFEVPVQLSWNMLPLIIMLTCATYGVGTTIGLMCLVICLYYTTTTICTEAFAPERMYAAPRDGPGRTKMITNGFGLKSDLEVVQLYRTQQIFNVLMSSMFRSVLISFHHIGLLATIVSLIVFAIKYETIMSESGPVAYVLVFSCMVAPIMVIYFQCKMGGAVVDISEDFKFSGEKNFPRKTVFRKFAKSCTTFYIEVTYPFYTIHKETFTMFGEQVVDWSMDFLLS